MAVDAKIVIGLDVAATRGNIEGELNSIVHGLKPEVVLDVAANTHKAEKQIESVIQKAKQLNVVQKKGLTDKEIEKAAVAKSKEILKQHKNQVAALAETEKVAKKTTKQITELEKAATLAGLGNGSDTQKGINKVKKLLGTDLKNLDAGQLKSLSKNLKDGINDVNKSFNNELKVDKFRNNAQKSFNDLKNSLNSIKLGEVFDKDLKKINKALTESTSGMGKNQISAYVKSVSGDISKLENAYKSVAKAQEAATSGRVISQNMKTHQGYIQSISGIVDDGFIRKLDLLQSKYTKYDSLMNKIRNNSFKSSAERNTTIGQLSNIGKEISDITSGLKEFDSKSFAGFTKGVTTLQGRLKTVGREWSKFKGDVDLTREYNNMVKASKNITSSEGLKQLNTQFSQWSARVKTAGKDTQNFVTRAGNMFRKLGMYIGASSIMYGGAQLVKDMITNVKNLDTAMVELRKVSSASESEIQAFYNRSKKTAVQIGTTMTDMINATADFSRLGYGIGDAEKLAKTATIYKNVGDGIENIDDSTSVLISTMKAFDIQAKDSMSIADKFNEVGNNYAISSGDIGIGLMKSASYLESAGNTIDQSIGMVTGMTEITQDSSAAGNALKILAMRLRGAKTELEEAGESTDGMAESSSKLREKIAALTNVDGTGGFDIMKNEDEFKSTFDIMKGIADVWDDMSNIDQAALLELIAGKNRGNQIAALLKNFSQAEAAFQTSLDSEGSAMKENEIYLDSIQAKTDQFKASLESLSATLINGDFVKGIVDFGRSGVENLNSLITNLNGVKGVLTAIGTTIGVLNFSGIANRLQNPTAKIADRLENVGYYGLSTRDYYRQNRSAGRGRITSAAGSIKNVTTEATKGMSVVAKFTNGLMGIGLAVGAITTAYEIYSAKQEKARQQAVDDIVTMQDRQSAVTDYMQRIKDLRAVADSDTASPEERYDARKELIGIEEELVGLYGSQAGAIDLINGKLQEQLGLMQELSDKEAESWYNSNKKAADKAMEEMSKSGNLRIGKEGSINGLDLKKFYSDLGFAITETNKGIYASYDSVADGISKLDKAASEARDNANAARDEGNEKLVSAWENEEKRITDKLSKLKEIEADYGATSSQAFDFLAKDNQNYADAYNKYTDALERMKEARASGDALGEYESFKLAQNELQGLIDKSKYLEETNFTKYFENQLNSLRESIKSVGKLDLSDTSNAVVKNLRETIEAYTDEMGKLDSSALLDDFMKYQDDLANGTKKLTEEQTKNMKALKEAFENSGMEDPKQFIDWLDSLGNLDNVFASATEKASNLKDALNSATDTEESRQKIDDITRSIMNLSEAEREGKATNDLLGLGFLDFDAAAAVAGQDIDSLSEALRNVDISADGANLKIETLSSLLRQAGMDQEAIDEILVDIGYKSDDASAAEAGKKGSETAQNNSTPVKVKFEAEANIKNVVKDAGKKIGEKLSSIKVQGKSTTEVKTNKINTEVSGIDDVNKLNSSIKNVSGKTVKVSANTSGSEQVKSLRSYINSLPSRKTITVVVQGVVSGVSSAVNKVSSAARGAVNRLRYTGTYSDFNTGRNSHKSGMSNAVGRNQIKKDEESLVGELGQELLVRPSTGEWITIGDRGPEFMSLKKGDIIFNARQTKDLLTTGHIVNRGKAYANGTATTYENLGRSLKIGAKVKIADISVDDSSLEEKLKDDLDKLKKKTDRIVGDYEFTISMMEYKNNLPSDMIAVYRRMQEEAHKMAQEYRKKGLSDQSDFIQDLQKNWMEYEQKIRELRIKEYEDFVKNGENAVKLVETMLNNAIDSGDYHEVQKRVNETISYYREMQKKLHEEAQYYRSLGYSDTSDEVANLSLKWREYQKNIEEVAKNSYQTLVDNAKKALEEVTNSINTFKTAAENFHDTSYISIDTFKDLSENGLNYLSLLDVENGKLVINKKTTEELTKAKVQQLAIQTALNYVEQLTAAKQKKDVDTLKRLLNVTTDSTKESWNLVYAHLALANLSDNEYKVAIKNLSKYQSIAVATMDSIGKSTESLSDSLDDILDYVISIIEKENEDHIDALEKQRDRFKEIVDLKKESLRVTKEEDAYNKDVAQKTKKIAELQSRINLLSLDDSREAYAERTKLEEELNELQNELNEKQNDRAVELTEEALDKQYNAYEKEIDAEIKATENLISSYQKKYDLALEYIQTHWDELGQLLVNWNYEYGDNLTVEIKKAWAEALEEAGRYGDYLTALKKKYEDIWAYEPKAIGEIVKEEEEAPSIVSNYDETPETSLYQAQQIVEHMKRNSQDWKTASPQRRKELADENADLAKQIEKLLDTSLYRDASGTWRLWTDKGEKLYDADLANLPETKKYLTALTTEMMENSQLWHVNKKKYLDTGNVDYKDEYEWLANRNVEIANIITGILGYKLERRSDGTWYLAGTNSKLYNQKWFLGKFHGGGVVGESYNIKDNEGVAILEKGEIVLDDNKKEGLYRLVDLTKEFGGILGKISTGVFGNVNSINGITNRSDISNLISKKSGSSVVIDASISINGDVDKTIWDKVYTQLKDHQRQVAEIVNNEQLAVYRKGGVF